MSTSSSSACTPTGLCRTSECARAGWWLLPERERWLRARKGADLRPDRTVAVRVRRRPGDVLPERGGRGPGATRRAGDALPRRARSRCSSPRARRRLVASRRAAAHCRRLTPRAAPRRAGRDSARAAEPPNAADAELNWEGAPTGRESPGRGAACEVHRPKRPSRGVSAGPSPAPRRAAASASTCRGSARGTFSKTTLCPRAHTQPKTRRASATRQWWLWTLREPETTPAP